MTPIDRRHFIGSAAALALLPGAAHAQADYPARTIALFHGFGAGGNADVVSRLFAQKLQEQLKQSVIVDIKSGAGGAIATDFVSKARPDGYTLVMLTGAHTVSAALRKNLPYDPVKDFSFVSTVTSFPFVVAVRAEHPAKNLAELIAMARKEPGKLTFTSVGVGSTQHMVGELLGSSAGVELLHVPYRGGGAPVQAVIGGDVDILTDTLTVATPHLKSGRLRALGVTSATAWHTAPDIPTVASVVPGFEVRSWLGLAMPAQTPPAIVASVNKAVQAVARDAEVRQSLGNMGSEASTSSPEQMKAMVEREIERWRAVIKKANIAQQ